MDFTEQQETTDQPTLGLVFFWAETVMPSDPYPSRATAGQDPRHVSLCRLLRAQG